MSRLSGKKIVLTGANSGIGFEILKILVSQGNTVFAVDLSIDNIITVENTIPYSCDISVKENIDLMIEEADLSMGMIDMVCANAGYSIYGEIGPADWDEMDRIFRTNVYSPIYTYEKYAEYLDGREGIFAVTDSAMGIMGMPGFSLYTSTKFAVNGFQDAIRYEVPDNIHITVLYPVSTDTNFFRVANAVEFEKPFPVQKPDHVAEMMIKGIEKRKKKVFPCRLFSVSIILFRIFPFIKWIYMRSEIRKFRNHTEKVRGLNSKS